MLLHTSSKLTQHLARDVQRPPPRAGSVPARRLRASLQRVPQSWPWPAVARPQNRAAGIVVFRTRVSHVSQWARGVGRTRNLFRFRCIFRRSVRPTRAPHQEGALRSTAALPLLYRCSTGVPLRGTEGEAAQARRGGGAEIKYRISVRCSERD